MIRYKKFTLDNGLRVVLQRDMTTPLVAVNVLYNVGSKFEDPSRTGFAHLFEHLMFGGSAGAPSFDDPVQLAGGECNAFTNSDLTNFFTVLPAENLELALFLEADRMENLILNERSLGIQRNVVVEEFKETCLNQPYGDMWHLLAPLAYHRHPYKWPTIGREISHISEATIDDVRNFYEKFYTPDNAICVVSGNIDYKRTLNLIRRHFETIPHGSNHRPVPPTEPAQHSMRRLRHEAEVPVDALYLAFHMGSRTDVSYYTADLLSDILASGESSRLFRVLVKDKQICSEADAYITGTIEPGLVIIEAKPADEESLADIEHEIWTVLEELKSEQVPEREFKRHQNKIESSVRFSNCSILNKAMNLAYFELIGEPELINNEHHKYASLSRRDLQSGARQIFREDNCSILEYRQPD